MAKKDLLGRRGEDDACTYIKRLGMTVLERNFRCNFGEVDIVALDEHDIVFIEVKTRSSVKYGEPIEAVNYYKRQHLRRCAEAYMKMHWISGKSYRIDIAEVLVIEGKSYIRYTKDAIGEE